MTPTGLSQDGASACDSRDLCFLLDALGAILGADSIKGASESGSKSMPTEWAEMPREVREFVLWLCKREINRYDE